MSKPYRLAVSFNDEFVYHITCAKRQSKPGSPRNPAHVGPRCDLRGKAGQLPHPRGEVAPGGNVGETTAKPGVGQEPQRRRSSSQSGRSGLTDPKGISRMLVCVWHSWARRELTAARSLWSRASNGGVAKTNGNSHKHLIGNDLKAGELGFEAISPMLAYVGLC
jgi:hypothetical protein